MPTRPALIRSLERHRAASRLRSSAAKPTITEGLMVSWIHHDNMLEGVMYRPDEIATALQKKDGQLPRYLQPLMEEIRRYAKVPLILWSVRQRKSAKWPRWLHLRNYISF